MSAATFRAVRAFIRAAQVAEGPRLPSLAVAVASRGRLVWEAGFGWADREARVPATPHTVYAVASVTKAITGIALMVMRERGLLDLDRPINDYLEPSPVTVHVGDAGDVTVRRVANHTAGLTTHYQGFPANGPNRRPPIAETIRRYGHTFFAPGAGYALAHWAELTKPGRRRRVPAPRPADAATAGHVTTGPAF
jgi:CubicO group peptidase (beta-lactamase class C family)